MRWKLEEFDGAQLLGTYFLPGNLGLEAVIGTMRQLVARHLSPEDIILSNLRRGTAYRRVFLDVMKSSGTLQVGENPFVVARKVEE